jgi:hypothetical protein
VHGVHASLSADVLCAAGMWWTIAQICMCAVLGITVVGLLLFHLNLIFQGQTTYESIQRASSLYSEGCTHNCYNVWLRPVPPAYVDFSKGIEEAERLEPPEFIKMCNPQWADKSAIE